MASPRVSTHWLFLVTMIRKTFSLPDVSRLPPSQHRQHIRLPCLEEPHHQVIANPSPPVPSQRLPSPHSALPPQTHLHASRTALRLGSMLQPALAPAPRLQRPKVGGPGATEASQKSIFRKQSVKHRRKPNGSNDLNTTDNTKRRQGKAKRFLGALKVEVSWRSKSSDIGQKASVDATAQTATAPTIPRFDFGAILGAITAGAALEATSVSTARLVIAHSTRPRG